jgi:glutamyl-tRNA reductase
MHQIGVVGLSYRHAAVEQVARFALAREAIGPRLPQLQGALGGGEVLYLGTCNRVEVVFVTPDGEAASDAREAVFRVLAAREPTPGEAARILRAWTGEAAVEHLFLVACGLDSAQTGEQEIAAQLRLAWEESRAARTCGPLIDRLMGEALGMARQVRRLAAGVRAPSLGDLAAEHALGHLNGGTGRVALVGVSPMTRRCAARLNEARVPLTIVNRSAAAGEELAAALGAEALTLERFRAAPPAVAAVVLAAGGGEPVLDESALARLAARAGAALLIDFGVPPNVEPAAAARAGLRRLGMDHLIEAAQGQRIAELTRLAPVRAAIDARLAHLTADFAARALGPRLAHLRATFEGIAAEEVTRALAHELRTLDEEQRVQLGRLGRTLALKLAHLPLAGLKAAAVHTGTETFDAFFDAAHTARARTDKEPI